MPLKIKGLSYSLEHKQVLKNLNLEIKEGKINAILGANGSGKSTLLRLIAGLLEPDSGEITFHEIKVVGPAQKLLPGHPEVSLVKQDSSLFPFHTVRQNLVYQLRQYNKEYQEQKIDELSRILGLNKNLDRVQNQLSGGEQQRVAIAAALAANPKLLLMDEPFSQADMFLKFSLREYLLHVASQLKISILYVTHGPEDALAFADEIFILDKGKIIEKGDSKAIYFKPSKKATAFLTGYCNWLPSNDFPPLKMLHKINNEYLVRPCQVKLNVFKEALSFKARVEDISFFGSYQFIHLLLLESRLKITASIITNFKEVLPGEEYWATFVD